MPRPLPRRWSGRPGRSTSTCSGLPKCTPTPTPYVNSSPLSERLGVTVSDLVREGLSRELPPLRATLGMPPRESATQESP